MRAVLLFLVFLTSLATAQTAAISAASPKPSPPPTTVINQASSTVSTGPLDGTKDIIITRDATGQTVKQAGKPDTRFNLNQLKVTQQGTWPTCPKMPPASETRHNACTPPLVGPGWDQVHGWTPVAYPTCWSPLPWQPATMPADACHEDTTPPPAGPLTIDMSYANQSTPEFSDFLGQLSRDDVDAYDLIRGFKATANATYLARATTLVNQMVADAQADINAGRNPDLAGDSYLYAHDYIVPMSFVYSMASLTTAQKTALKSIADQTYFNIWNPSQAKWGTRPAPWSGWATDNPVNNYHIRFVRLSAAWAWASQDAAKMADVKNVRIPFLIEGYNRQKGGGDLEGTGYGYAQYDGYDTFKWTKDTTGIDYAAQMQEEIANNIRFWVYATTPDLKNFMPIGDQARSSIPVIYDYQRVLVRFLSWLTTDSEAKALGSWWVQNIALQHRDMYRANYGEDLWPIQANAPVPTKLTFYAKEVGLISARNSWASNATLFTALVGEFSESHAHQDFGSFTLVYGSNWGPVTSNIWSHSGIQQETQTNNIMRFQTSGSQVAQTTAASKPSPHDADPQNIARLKALGIAKSTKSAKSVAATASIIGQRYATATVSSLTQNPSTGETHFMADLSPMYVGTGVNQWRRQFDFAGEILTITDYTNLNAGIVGIEQVQIPGTSAQRPVISGNTIRGQGFTVTVTSPANPQISLVWMPDTDSDFNSGWRAEWPSPAAGGQFKVSKTP